MKAALLDFLKVDWKVVKMAVNWVGLKAEQRDVQTADKSVGHSVCSKAARTVDLKGHSKADSSAELKAASMAASMVV